jgi:hypothetical protein
VTRAGMMSAAKAMERVASFHSASRPPFTPGNLTERNQSCK